MKKLIIVMLLIYVQQINGQFNKRLFRWEGVLRQYGVEPLGDWNSDGKDEFLVYACSSHQILIFFGGNPMDSLPRYTINVASRKHKTMDANHDGYLDIVVASGSDIQNDSITFKIYFGGPSFDTIPSQVFRAPLGVSLNNFAFLLCVLPNFDGTNSPVLMVSDYEWPFTLKQRGLYYLYRSSTNGLDSVPFRVFAGDSLLLQDNYHLFEAIYASVGDINGDGLTDILIPGEKHTQSKVDYFIQFYLGNAEWNLTPAVTYYQSQHRFRCDWNNKIIKDINKDGRDDILIANMGGYFPPGYSVNIWYGNFPIDTIPRIGLYCWNAPVDLDLPVISPGDVNGDGYNDLLFSVWLPEALLYLGGNPMYEEPRQFYRGDNHCRGRLLARVGDVNGDGLDDICVGEGCNYNCDDGYVEIYGGDTLYREPSAVEIEPKGRAVSFEISEAYPNPFNGSCTIGYEVHEAGKTEITVYDILGRTIREERGLYRLPGKYDYVFEGQDKPGGMYFVRFKFNNNMGEQFTQTKKICYVK